MDIIISNGICATRQHIPFVCPEKQMGTVWQFSVLQRRGLCIFIVIWPPAWFAFSFLQESLYVAVAELKDIPRIGSKCKFHLPVVVLILAS